MRHSFAPPRRLPEPPQEIGHHAGLCFARFRPPQKPWGSVLILHGADSAKESHYAFARAARSTGLEAIAFDMRGHGESDGPLDERVLEDVATMASLLAVSPLILRGSSMGGYLALIAAAPLRAGAVVAICPAPDEHLLRGLRDGRFSFPHAPGLAAQIAAHPVLSAAAELDMALLLLHAEGDELIAPAHTAELHQLAPSDHKRLLIVPGGHHRSIQHDGELHGESLRFLRGALRPRGDAGS